MVNLLGQNLDIIPYAEDWADFFYLAKESYLAKDMSYFRRLDKRYW